ncbi:MAG: HAD family hydrolase [Chloroflexales bacterium]|nr:HAD family hydrolase [Chloroflexales bacterium]
MPPMIKALIFDFDGLIIDTETPALESWQQIYAEHGHTIGLDVWAGALGTNHGFDALEHLLTLVAAASPERAAALRAEAAAIRLRRQDLKDKLSAGQPLLPGVLDTLDQARAMGLPCAVASSSGRAWVEGWLSRHGIIDRFACVLTGDDVERTKPDPALFLMAAACLGLSPAACLVFEDSPNGIVAARAAGCPVVAVPGAITGRLDLPPADLTVASLDAAPLDELIAAVLRSAPPLGRGEEGGSSAAA